MIADDDNAFYCPTDATLGNAVLNFYGQHTEGGSVHALAQYSHAEGCGSIAEGRYAHAEGNITTAGGAGAHAEGGAVLGTASYKDGTASGAGSHAGGYKTLAKGNWSYAGGEQTSAVGRCTFAIGDHAQALSDDMFVWNGIRNTTYIPTNYNAAAGYFCVNPKSSISGFYIGSDNFI